MMRTVRDVSALVFFACLFLSSTLRMTAAPRTECFDKRCSLYALQESCHGTGTAEPCYVTASDPGFCSLYCEEWCDVDGHTGDEACGGDWLECFCSEPIPPGGLTTVD